MIEFKDKEENAKTSLKDILKNHLYNFYTDLHNLVSYGKYQSFLIMLFSFLNIFAFILNDEINIKIVDPIFDITSILRILRISFYIKQNDTIFIVSIYIMFILNLILIIALTYFLFSSTNSSLYLKELFFLMNTLNYWIFIMPVIDLNLQIFIIIKNQTADSSVLLNSNLYVFFSIFNIVVSLIFALIFSFLGHKSLYLISNSDGFSRADSNFEVIFLFLRIAKIFFIFIVKMTSISFYYFLLLCFVYNCFMIKFNFDKILYYDIFISNTFNYFIFLNMWVVLVAFVMTTTYKDPFFTLLVGVLFLIYLSNNYLKHIYIHMTEGISFVKLKSVPYKADKFFKYMIYLSKNLERTESRIILNGIAYNHIKECPNQNCLLKSKECYYIPKENKFFNKEDYDQRTRCYSLIFILNMFKFFISQKNCPLVMILCYLNFQYENIGNDNEILFHLNNPTFEEISSIQQDFSLFRLNKLLEVKILKQASITFDPEQKKKYRIDEQNSDKRYNLDLDLVIRYYRMVSEFKLSLAQSSNSNYNFWNSLILSYESKTIYRDGLNLYTLNDQLEALFENIMRIYNKDSDLIYRYSTYIKLIKGDEKYSLKLSNKIIDFKKDSNDFISVEKMGHIKDFCFSNNSVIVIAYFNKERSFIEKTSETVFNVFGYTPHQIIGKEVDSLMPNFFRKRHSSFVNCHFETGIKRVNGVYRNLFGLHKDSYIFPLTFILFLLPNFEKKFLYLGLLRKEETETGYMLVEPKGRIDSCCEKVGEFFKIDPKTFVENDLYIYHFIRDYIKEGATNKSFSLRKLNISASPMRKFEYCHDREIITNIIKNSKFFDHGSSEKNVTTKQHILQGNEGFFGQYHSQLKSGAISGSFTNLETEIFEENYNIGFFATEKNTLLTFKIYFDSLEDKSINVADKTNMRLRNTVYINELDSDKNNEDRKMIIKDLREVENRLTSKIKQLFLEKESPNKKEKHIESVSGSSNSMMLSTSFYLKYYSFQRLIKNKKENSFTTLSIFKFTMLSILVGITILIYILQTANMLQISEAYNNFNTIFPTFNDLNCIELSVNSLLLSNITNSKIFNHTYDKVMLENCLQSSVINQNNLTKLSSDSANQNLKSMYLNMNFTPISSPLNYLNPNLPYIPSYLFENFILNVMNNIYLRFKSNLYQINDELNFLQSNLKFLILQLKTTNSNLSGSLNSIVIGNNQLMNLIFLLIKIAIIIFSFIVILPLLFMKKKNQLKILENFFRIKIEDIENQRENCRIYLTSMTNIKIEINIEAEANKEDEKSDEKKKEGKKGKDVKGKGKDKEKDKDGKDKEKEKKKKSKKHTFLSAKKFSIQSYIIKIFSFTLFVIIVFALIPLISYFYQNQAYTLTNSYLANKNTIDNYQFYLLRSFIETQDIFISQLIVNRSYDFSFYNETMTNLTNGRLNFQNIQPFVLSIDTNGDLINLLNNNTCSLFTKYNITDLYCNGFMNNNSSNLGLQGISSTAGYNIGELKNLILSANNFNLNFANLTLNNQNFYSTEIYFKSFIYKGYTLFSTIMSNYFQNLINSNNQLNLILMIVFIVLSMGNYLFVWNKIEKNIRSLEIETFKVFSIIPMKVVHDYTCLMDYLIEVTQD